MNNDTIRIDPELGVWTPEYVRECLQSKTDDEFRSIYGKTKEAVRQIASMPKVLAVPDRVDSDNDTSAALRKEVATLKEALTTAETTIEELNLKLEQKGGEPDAEKVAFEAGDDDQSRSLFTEEEQTDLDEMHWKTFESKYDMKPAEFEEKRKAERANEEQGGEDDSEA